ncbi:FtsK/SpoIIIE family protein [Mycobacteroides abscessus subsp. bolletii]|uniref:FtsK/SpoIIIE domain-containing protein n=1 Tax=Mycobacteroides abscessus TaxID=36809 RepID=UPI0009D0A74D|nr:FtsK/SpoIIIE domain-containing protein [Mycobacteroides abscessus]SKU75349.1 FtsK/SpoIIIE family protein [Mycobacteroides abscessus subsp. bolletii]
MASAVPFDQPVRRWPWIVGSVLLLIGLLASSTLTLLAFAVLIGLAVRRWRRRLARTRFVEQFPSVSRGLVSSFLLNPGLLSVLFGSTGLTRVLGDSVVEPIVVSIRPSPRGVDVWLRPVPGQSLNDYRKASEALAMVVKVLSVAVSPAGTGDVLLSFNMNDPLASSLHVDAIQPATSWALSLGVHADGTPALVGLSNRSGVVCAGQPGSGKTAGIRGALAAFMPYLSFQLAVMDGKGGTDWQAFSRRAFFYSNDDTDLEGFVRALESLEELRRYRAANMLKWRGTSNFWDDGPSDDLPLVVLVIDECQTFFDPNYQATKDGKALSARAVALTSSIVKKGRSSGLLAVSMTQRSVVTALPSQIRDDSGLRISYRVANRDGADVALGDGWLEAGESPIGLPQGICVYTSDDGGFVRARSPFVPEAVIAAACEQFSDRTRDPRKGLPSQVAAQDEMG